MVTVGLLQAHGRLWYVDLPPPVAMSLPSRTLLTSDSFHASVAHALAPFLGQGANQAIQDAQCLALAVARVGSEFQTLGDALRFYQDTRNPPTDAIIRSSIYVGWLETQGGLLGMAFRDTISTVEGVLGIPAKILFSSALPRVGK